MKYMLRYWMQLKFENQDYLSDTGCKSQDQELIRLFYHVCMLSFLQLQSMIM